MKKRFWVKMVAFGITSIILNIIWPSTIGIVSASVALVAAIWGNFILERQK